MISFLSIEPLYASVQGAKVPLYDYEEHHIADYRLHVQWKSDVPHEIRDKIKGRPSQTPSHPTDSPDSIDTLIGHKISLNCLSGDPNWFLAAKRKTGEVKIQQYANPKRSLSHFDERHWELCSEGIKDGKPVYRLQYVSIPGFSQPFCQSLAAIERNGKISLELTSQLFDFGQDDTDKQWRIVGSLKYGALFENMKYGLFLQGSPQNQVSLVPLSTTDGLKWHLVELDNYSRSLIMLGTNFNSRGDKNNQAINLGGNPLSSFSFSLPKNISFSGFPLGWSYHLTHPDSTVTFFDPYLESSMQEEVLVTTATRANARNPLYSTATAILNNIDYIPEQSWVLIPVESGSDRYYMYLKDSEEKTIVFVLSLQKEKIVLTPQDLYNRTVPIKDLIPLEIGIMGLAYSQNEYINTLRNALGDFLSTNDLSTEIHYLSISSSFQKSIIALSGPRELTKDTQMSTHKNSQTNTVSFEGAMKIKETAFRAIHENDQIFNLSSATPACLIASLSRGLKREPEIYVLFTDEKEDVTGYDPITGLVAFASKSPDPKKHFPKEWPYVWELMSV